MYVFIKEFWANLKYITKQAEHFAEIYNSTHSYRQNSFLLLKGNYKSISLFFLVFTCHITYKSRMYPISEQSSAMKEPKNFKIFGYLVIDNTTYVVHFI